jgi:hypothetical protein
VVAAVIGVVRVDRFASARIGVEIANLSDPLTHGAPAGDSGHGLVAVPRRVGSASLTATNSERGIRARVLGGDCEPGTLDRSRAAQARIGGRPR